MLFVICMSQDMWMGCGDRQKQGTHRCEEASAVLALRSLLRLTHIIQSRKAIHASLEFEQILGDVTNHVDR